jgi:hypothetical protein
VRVVVVVQPGRHRAAGTIAKRTLNERPPQHVRRAFVAFEFVPPPNPPRMARAFPRH